MLKLVLTIASLSITCGLAGCFLLWKRLTFFSDSLSHGAFFGIVAALILSKSTFIGAGLVGLMFVIALNYKTSFPKELWLSILASVGLSLGIIFEQLFPNINALDIFVGDIINVEWLDVYLMLSSSILLALFSIIKFKEIILIIMDENFALSEGVNVKKIKFILLSLITFGLISSLKVTGSLITPGLFTLMPTLAYGGTCSIMIISTIVLTFLHTAIGIYFSNFLDISQGPVIIILGFISLLIKFIFNAVKSKE